MFFFVIAIFRNDGNLFTSFVSTCLEGFLFIFLIITVLVLVLSVEDILFDGGIFGDEFKQGQTTANRIAKTENGYEVYYLDKENEFTSLLLDEKIVDIQIKESNTDRTYVEYEARFSRRGKILEDNNYVSIYLPKGYNPEPIGTQINSKKDLEFNHLIRNECINEMRYEGGQFSFYILDDYLTEYNFKETDYTKVKFTVGDTKGKKACLNFDYYETLNGDLYQKIGHKPVYEIIIPKDFDLSSIKK